MRLVPALTGGFIVGAAFLLPAPEPLHATDRDRGNDCERFVNEWGDAPELLPAYPGVIGHFPTCAFTSAPGTQESECPPISTAPGPTGHVFHISPFPGGGYWLGCYGDATGPHGVDSETDGLVNTPPVGYSFCPLPDTIFTDCVQLTPWGMGFDQDECYGDGSDASLRSLVVFEPCGTGTIPILTFNCSPSPRPVFLNICVDMNADGDWNDSFLCPDGSCAYEWVVKNAGITLPSGCFLQPSPPFRIGPRPGDGWMRITISDNPAPDDFPWNGSGSVLGPFGSPAFQYGETEDYPVLIAGPTPTTRESWGGLKVRYRP